MDEQVQASIWSVKDVQNRKIDFLTQTNQVPSGCSPGFGDLLMAGKNNENLWCHDDG